MTMKIIYCIIILLLWIKFSYEYYHNENQMINLCYPSHGNETPATNIISLFSNQFTWSLRCNDSVRNIEFDAIILVPLLISFGILLIYVFVIILLVQVESLFNIFDGTVDIIGFIH